MALLRWLYIVATLLTFDLINISCVNNELVNFNSGSVIVRFLRA